jgi:hypothetical protein
MNRTRASGQPHCEGYYLDGLHRSHLNVEASSRSRHFVRFGPVRERGRLTTEACALRVAEKRVGRRRPAGPPGCL